MVQVMAPEKKKEDELMGAAKGIGMEFLKGKVMGAMNGAQDQAGDLGDKKPSNPRDRRMGMQF